MMRYDVIDEVGKEMSTVKMEGMRRERPLLSRKDREGVNEMVSP